MLSKEEARDASQIHVLPFDIIAVEKLVSHALRMSRRLIRPLADVVLRKTDGNTSFVVQFLVSLCDEGLLLYNDKNQRWSWDLDQLLTREIPDDIVDLFMAKIENLDADARGILTLAACVGSTFSESTLHVLSSESLACSEGTTASNNTARPTTPALEPVNSKRSVKSINSLNLSIGVDLKGIAKKLEKNGLLMRVEVGSRSRYKFAHDQIQQAAYQLTPE
eukprot:11978937-Ditylum_brightwellii.AAC.1